MEWFKPSERLPEPRKPVLGWIYGAAFMILLCPTTTEDTGYWMTEEFGPLFLSEVAYWAEIVPPKEAPECS